MRRWQDCGEVQDSDEEELSVELQDSGAGRPHERLKSAEDDDFDSRAPIQRRDALQSSGRFTSSGSVSHVDSQALLPAVELDGREDAAVQHGRSMWQLDGDKEDDSRPAKNDFAWLSNGPERTDGRQAWILKHVAISPKGNFDPQSDPLDSAPSTPRNLSAPPDSASSSKSLDGLPELGDFLRPGPLRLDTLEGLRPEADPSNASSPLSDPPDSPTLQSAFGRYTPRIQLPDATPRSQTAARNNASLEEWQQAAVSPDSGRRALRARKQKQLHPYMYDKALYQQQCRERGIKPVRLVEFSAMESQMESLGTDIDNSLESQRRSSSPAWPTDHFNVDFTTADTSRRLADDDDEFPRPASPRNRNVGSRVQSSHKRRRLNLPANSMAKVSERQTPHGEHSEDEFGLPPSPPSSTHEPSVGRLDSPSRSHFRFPRGLSPVATLPTPQVSSDIPSATKNDLDGNSVKGALLPPLVDQQQTIQPRVTIDFGSLTESDSDGPTVIPVEPDSRKFSKEKKRIRGVLPASWLRIDMMAQRAPVQSTAMSPAADDRHHSPPPLMVQKGVARRATAHRPSSAEHTDAVVISDDEGSSDESSTAPGPPVWRQQRLQFEQRGPAATPNDFVDVDEMEMDWIDPLLPGASHPRAGTRRAKKRQRTIHEALGEADNPRQRFSEERANWKAPKVRRPKAITSTRKPHKQASRRARAPPLSILDAPKSSTSPARQQPQFVRIAARQARNKPDNGRHSPTRKIIRLATGNDTNEATETLHQWRQGSIAPRSINHLVQDSRLERSVDSGQGPLNEGGNRIPLADVANNNQRHGSWGSRESLREPGAARSAAGRLRVTVPNRLARPNVLSMAPRPRQGVGKSSTRREPATLYRGAQLESLEGDFYRDHRSLAFEDRIRRLTKAVSANHWQSDSARQVSQFLRETDRAEELPGASTDAWLLNQKASASRPIALSPARPQRRRKRQPIHIDVEAREYRQPSEPLPTDVTQPPEISTESSDSSILHGLGSVLNRYAIDFDIQSLPPDTYFHESSFIGSGDFAESLELGGRCLDASAGRIRIHVDEEVFEWAAWTDEVGTQLSQVPRAVRQALDSVKRTTDSQEHKELLSIALSNIDHVLKSVIRYCTRCLYFLDRVDRRSCVRALVNICDELSTIAPETAIEGEDASHLRVRLLQYALVLASQAEHIAHDAIVPPELRFRSEDALKSIATRLASTLLTKHLHHLRTFYEDNRHASKREAGVRDDHSAISAFVQLHHVLQASSCGMSFWKSLNGLLGCGAASVCDVQVFERLWYNTFTLLPALDFDVHGIVRRRQPAPSAVEDWSLLRLMAERTFELYDNTSSAPGSSINDYVRAILTRCVHLVTRWRWWRCESMLGSVFDFFAKRGLSMLRKEESKGSPAFLGELASTPSMEVQRDDTSYHIFLKLLATALTCMRDNGVYSEKKIGMIFWRFVPSHTRSYRKDADLQQADLDALRNHYDLLCTLYFASPPDHRIRIDLLRNLVDLSTSHREACRTSVRAWTYLATFQASSNESLAKLDPFCEWFKDMTRITVSQYRLARTEAENDFHRARAQGTMGLSVEYLETVVSRNQRQLAVTLVDALAGIKRAIGDARDVRVAAHLVKGCEYWNAFLQLEVSERHLNAVFNEGLEVMRTCLEVSSRLQPNAESQQTSEDSQDFGDASALQEFAAAEDGLQSALVGESDDDNDMALIHVEPMRQVVSNALGAEVPPDEVLLTKMVDIWASIAASLVRSGRRCWSNFVDDYSASSWCHFRDTEQRRRFTPYFLAKVVDGSGGAPDVSRNGILTAWLRCLVERESVLKYQHVLTSAALNAWSDEAMLQNLPFVRDRRTGGYSVSLHDVRQRRLSVVSSVLANMREAFEDSARRGAFAVQETRKTYADMLRQMMQSMKSNYQEAQGSDDDAVAEAGAQGAYVHFVQQVVSLLQQHTTEICPIDRFFTDSSAFPLPADDPTYVVGRLRSYVAKLSEARTRKQLAVFVHTVGERAAMDGQQAYLVDQLDAAMAGAPEVGSGRTPSLSHVLLTAVVPVYVERALSTACSWILALPLLEASAGHLTELLYCVDSDDAGSVRAAEEMTEALLRAASEAVSTAARHPGLLRLPHVQRTLAGCFDACRASLVASRYLRRLRRSFSAVHKLQRWIVGRAREVGGVVADGLEMWESETLAPASVARDGPWPDTRAFVAKQVRESLGNDWHAVDGQYFVRRGSGSKEVVLRLDEGAERQRVLRAIRRLRESYDGIRCRRRGRRRVDTAPQGGEGGGVAGFVVV